MSQVQMVQLGVLALALTVVVLVAVSGEMSQPSALLMVLFLFISLLIANTSAHPPSPLEPLLTFSFFRANTCLL